MNFIEQELRQLMARVKNLKSDEVTGVDKRLANKLSSRLEDCLFIAPHVLKPADTFKKNDMQMGTGNAVQSPQGASQQGTGQCICPPGAVDTTCPVHKS